MCHYWPTLPSWRMERVTSCTAQLPLAVIDQCSVWNDMTAAHFCLTSSGKNIANICQQTKKSFLTASYKRVKKTKILLCIDFAWNGGLSYLQVHCCNQFIIIWHKLRTYINMLLLYFSIHFYFSVLITLLFVSRGFGAMQHVHVQMLLQTVQGVQLKNICKFISVVNIDFFLKKVSKKTHRIHCSLCLVLEFEWKTSSTCYREFNKLGKEDFSTRIMFINFSTLLSL